MMHIPYKLESSASARQAEVERVEPVDLGRKKLHLLAHSNYKNKMKAKLSLIERKKAIPLCTLCPKPLAKGGRA